MVKLEYIQWKQVLTGHVCVPGKCVITHTDKGSLTPTQSSGYLFYDFDARLTVRPLSAMQQVLDNAGAAPASTGAKDIDLLFLRGIMESPTVRFNKHNISISATQIQE